MPSLLMVIAHWGADKPRAPSGSTKCEGTLRHIYGPNSPHPTDGLGQAASLATPWQHRRFCVAVVWDFLAKRLSEDWCVEPTIAAHRLCPVALGFKFILTHPGYVISAAPVWHTMVPEVGGAVGGAGGAAVAMEQIDAFEGRCLAAVEVACEGPCTPLGLAPFSVIRGSSLGIAQDDIMVASPLSRPAPRPAVRPASEPAY
jgi:hypothetical protein